MEKANVHPHPHELYTYQVIWSEEDGEFVGTCLEFPSLSCVEVGANSAFGGIRDMVAVVIDEMIEKEETLPTPRNARVNPNVEPLDPSDINYSYPGLYDEGG